MVKVEIITIGDELLAGHVVDTNSAWMAAELDKAGFSLLAITTIADNKEQIFHAIEEAAKAASIILLTGGLGPTRDDITKTTLCEYFNTKLVFSPEVYRDVRNFLKGRVDNINKLNHDQAMVPENCTIIRNPVGTAPVMWFDRNNYTLVSMPGVPHEMKHIMTNSVIPRLQYKWKPEIIAHRIVHIFNIPEAVLAEKLSDWEDRLADKIKISYLPSPGRLRLILSMAGSDKKKLDDTINKAIDQLYPIIGDNIIGFDNDDVSSELLNLLIKQNKTISCAESCSGGYLSHMLTAIPGASNAFKGGATAYSNEIKSKLLNVNAKDITLYGAVSRQVVEQMAKGAAKLFNTNYAIATSGIAGPSGGSKEKPVGTVWIAWYGDGAIKSKKFKFGSSRKTTIQRTAETGIIMLKQLIEKEEL